MLPNDHAGSNGLRIIFGPPHLLICNVTLPHDFEGNERPFESRIKKADVSHHHGTAVREIPTIALYPEEPDPLSGLPIQTKNPGRHGNDEQLTSVERDGHGG